VNVWWVDIAREFHLNDTEGLEEVDTEDLREEVCSAMQPPE